MRDEELAFEDECFLSGDAYAEHGPYDVDYSSLTGLPSSSRPTPKAYDDPYADSYNSLDVTESQRSLQIRIPTESSSFEYGRQLRGRRRGNRGRGERGHRGHGRGRHAGQRHPVPVSPSADQHTGYSLTQHQYEEYSPLYPDQHLPHPIALQNDHPMNYGSQLQNYSQPFVQPHINPRFASAFGFSVYPPLSPVSQGYAPAFSPHDFPHEQYGISSNSADDWSVPAQDGSTANSQSRTAQ